ncbi:hypothetical protein E1B28_001205 [Marasmius oreades]|uniref:Uncharacterized protein n=1 Tax=Marasmius oreades TaxID=181124 RepID=A0A9P7V314_9AGAR|nr:uncharacterized protein E1B28_001205 [Marasmius oreades]KAG7099349.1 hypothetical protein E1B28_001205 [Marasmius oreades]
MLANAIVLSDDSAIESVLSEIPFFCAGLVAFALLTFFLVMKRVDLLSVYLYSSTIFAFGAAVLDISQLLERGTSNIMQGTGKEAVKAIINTGEVGFSISVGLRFLFFWKFVAERPRGEPPPLGPALYTYSPREQAHSASWKRWGFLGLVLKWSLLLATLALPILQILWRIVFRTYGPVYLVESTMQIIISALFVLKLLLNMFLSPVISRWKTMVPNLAPFLALMLNLAIGIGSLVIFTFSETTLGRFLQAVELYILMLFVLISTFHNVPKRPPRADTASYIVSAPEKPTQAPPEVSPTSATREWPNLPSRTSRRLSSWIMARRSSHAPSGVRWLVTPVDVERDTPGNQQTKPADGIDPVLKVSNEGPIPRSNPLPSPTVTTPTRTQDGSIFPEQVRDRRPSTVFSLSYYGTTQPRDSGLSLPSTLPVPNRNSQRGAESPVYGLNGLVNQTVERKTQTSFSSLDELLRQQSELDKSIANLRLFSTFGTAPPDGRIGSSSSASKPSRTDRTFSSTSNHSEFSLSIFPDPPKFGESERIFQSSKFSTTLRAKRTSLLNAQRGSSADNGLISHAQPGRLDSVGTSYDVTSFIGGLTKPTPTPGHSHANSFEKDAPALSDVESGDEGSPPITAKPNQSSLGTEVVDGEQSTSTVRLRPFLLGNVTSLPSNPPPLAPRTLDPPAGPRKPIPRNLQVKPFISNPQRSRESDHAFDSTAFEKPRPAPSVSLS